MNKLFWGFFFLFLNFNLNLGSLRLNLLPDWAGLILLYLACGELDRESDQFEKIRPFCLGLAAATGVLWVLSFFGININPPIVSWVLGIAVMCLELYTSMMFVDALANVEMRRNYDLCISFLRKSWKVMAFSTFLSGVFIVFPVIALALSLVAAIATIVFLVAVHKTRKAWQNMLCEQSKPL